MVSFCVYLLLFKTRWGLRIRAVTQNRAMAGAAGINTERVDACTFALGCGLAGIAGSSFTMLASTGPVTGQQYIVDTFIVVVFGGVESLLGTFLSAVHHRRAAVDVRIPDDRLDGQGLDPAAGDRRAVLPARTGCSRPR